MSKFVKLTQWHHYQPIPILASLHCRSLWKILFNDLNDFSKLPNLTPPYTPIPHLWEFGASAEYFMHSKPFKYFLCAVSLLATKGSILNRARKSLKQGEFCGRQTKKCLKTSFFPSQASRVIWMCEKYFEMSWWHDKSMLKKLFYLVRTRLLDWLRLAENSKLDVHTPCSWSNEIWSDLIDYHVD